MSKHTEWRNNWKTAGFFLKIIYRRKKVFYLYIIVIAVLSSIGVYWPIRMTRNLMNHLIDRNAELTILSAALLVVGSAVLSYFNHAVNDRIDLINMLIIKEFEMMFAEKIIQMDFEDLEDNKTMEAKELSLEPIKQQNVLFRLINNIKEIAVSLVTVLILGSVIFSLSIWIPVIIIAILIINSCLYKKAQNAQIGFWRVITPINRRFGYYKNLANDYTMAKDVRIYNMQEYILGKIDAYDKESYNGFKHLFLKLGVCQGAIDANIQLQMLVVYIYTLFIVVRDQMKIGDFTMYIAAAQNFAVGLSKLSGCYIDFLQICQYLKEYTSFIHIPVKCQNGNKKTEGIDNISIEFHHVYFRYPGQENDILKDICIRIDQGEKIAVVGKNGAGKTTFIKLLCRLYVPSEGEILLNGINIQQYDFIEYMNLLSVVFQDYRMFSFSIKENILGNSDENRDKLEDVIHDIGLGEKIAHLNTGVDAKLLRVFDEEGIEFSGGESQKLAIARALYKDAPLVILDEATSALDPVAEYEIYEKFNILTQGKTTIFISHRMSACKLSDKIIVFSNGIIAECGSHKELLQMDGLYNSLWMSQAQFYNEKYSDKDALENAQVQQ